MKIISALCLAVLITLGHSAGIIDFAGKFSNYTCFKNQGFSQIIVRAYHSYGAIDLDAKANIFGSNSAGLATDTYMFPCRGKDPSLQARQLLDYLDSMRSEQSAFAYTTGTIWLDIETNPSPNCGWNLGNFDTNCQFIKTLVDTLQGNGRSVGIYASRYMWTNILGAPDRCTLFASLPLWYPHYDNVKSFDDWEGLKFGGWAQPAIKQYSGSSTVCGFNVDLSYY